MRQECNNYGMKPVCDHPTYCKTDTNAVYIGQTYHVAHRGNRMNTGYYPAGWTATQWDKWGVNDPNWCVYTNSHNNQHSTKALCGKSGDSHQWLGWSSSRWFMCASISDNQPASTAGPDPGVRRCYDVITQQQTAKRVPDPIGPRFKGVPDGTGHSAYLAGYNGGRSQP